MDDTDTTQTQSSCANRPLSMDDIHRAMQRLTLMDISKPTLRQIDIIESELMHDLIARPKRRHRKKRIQKKYNKRYGCDYEEVPWSTIYYVEQSGLIFCHPTIARQLRAQAPNLFVDNDQDGTDLASALRAMTHTARKASDGLNALSMSMRQMMTREWVPKKEDEDD